MSDASKKHECVQLLDTQIDIWEELLNLEREKQQVLLQGDVEKLNEIVGREEKLFSNAGNIEKQRYEAFSRLAASFGLPCTASLKEIVACCPAELAAALEETGDVLSKILQSIEGLNGQNLRLIHQSLDLIQFTVESLAVPQHTPTYNQQEKPQKSTVSFLVDQKI